MANAIGMIELSSIARGIITADAMLKAGQVDMITASSTCPGKYIAIVHGEVAAVEASMAAGITTAGTFLVDQITIANVHDGVYPALTATHMPEEINAIGIVESFSMATMLICTDAILKVAALEAIECRLGNGLGGKAFFVFTGDVAAVEAGVEAGERIAMENGPLVDCEIIPSPAPDLLRHLL